jgi:hypothetical protein
MLKRQDPQARLSWCYGVLTRARIQRGTDLYWLSSVGLETVEIIMEVEDHFGVSVPDEVASNCVTVADFQRALIELLARKGRARSPELEDAVYRDLVMIIVDQTGLNASDVRPDSRWVGDIPLRLTVGR